MAHGRVALVGFVAVLLAVSLLPAVAAPNDAIYVVGEGEQVSNGELPLRLSTLTIFDTRPRVVLARDDVFADALAAGVLQGIDGPLLLIPGTGPLPSDVRSEIRRLEPEEVVLLGGTAAIGPDVEAELAAEGYAVTRLSGPSRFDTAVAIANTVPSDVAILARGTGDEVADRAFADAIGIGGVAARNSIPVVLTAPEQLPGVTADYLRGRSLVYIVGGTAAISAEVEAQVRSLAGDVVRLAGASRAETAVRLAEEFYGPDAGSVEHVMLVPGQGDDAWAGGFASAHRAYVRGAPILLGVGDTLPPATAEWLRQAETRITPGRQDRPVLTCLVQPSVCDQAREALGNTGVVDTGSCTPRNSREGVEIYEQSAHWVIWWGGDAMGEDERLRIAAQRAIADLEYAWETGIGTGDLVLPPGAPELCTNVYLHDTGGGVAGDIGPGVGTDEEDYPFIALVPNIILPLADQPAGPNTGTIEYTQHEAFHVLQYNRPGTPYETYENVWWIESSAEWFTRQQYPTDTGSLNAVSAWFLYPHMPLWASFGTLPDGVEFDDTIGGHAYGGGYFLEYLTNEVTDPSLVYDAFSTVSQSGQRWLHDELERRGIDMAEPYADFITKAVTLDFSQDGFEERIENWLATANPRVDYRIAAAHDTPDTGGMVRVPDGVRPGAWAYNAIRADVPDDGTVTVNFEADAAGEFGTPSVFRVNVVVRDGDSRTVIPVPLTDGAGQVSVNAPVGSELWLAVASTPHLFSSPERFGYQYGLAG